MPKKYYSVQNKTDQSADILIYGVIGDSWFEESVTARQFIADLKALENDYQRINIKINSPGGSVFDGLPIFNAIRNSKAEIHTYNDGLCASMAAVILVAAPAGNVHSADNALLMLHSPYSGCYGNTRDMKQVMDMLTKVEDSLITCIESRGTQTADEIRAKYFDYDDHWLSVEEAEKEKLIDVIEKGSKKISNKVTTMPIDQIMNQFDSLVKGRNLFDRLFSQAHDIFSLNNDLDMDIKALRKACGLPDDATEQDVLDWIKDHGQTETTDQADEAAEEETDEAEQAEESAEEADDTEDSEEEDPKDKKIADLEKQVANLKKGPGITNKKVVKQTDAGNTALNKFETYASAKQTWDAVNKLFE
jgi:ATP-dependent Clp endopeptidase proteolytic subunit ClpP